MFERECVHLYLLFCCFHERGTRLQKTTVRRAWANGNDTHERVNVDAHYTRRQRRVTDSRARLSKTLFRRAPVRILVRSDAVRMRPGQRV